MGKIRDIRLFEVDWPNEDYQSKKGGRMPSFFLPIIKNHDIVRQKSVKTL